MENQDIKKDIPVQETEVISDSSFSSDTKIEKPYSKQFPNPAIAQKVEEQIKTYTKEHPTIEAGFNTYLTNHSDILKARNNLLETNITDTEKCKKIINNMIENSIKEATVFPQTKITETENNSKTDIDIKTLQEKTKIRETTELSIETKEQSTEKTEKTIKLFQETEIEYKKLIARNPKLDIKPNSPQYLEASKKLEASGTIKTLQDKGLTAENIDKFISFKATQEAIKADPSIQNTESFLLSFKKLENELDLPDSTREDFSSKNIEHTSQEIFNPEIGNQNLIDTVSKQKESHASDFEKLFNAPKDIGTLSNVYGKFLPESQKTYKTIQDKQEKKINLSQDDQTFLSRFPAELEAKKSEFETKTSNSMEQASILGPIMGLSDYMNMNIGNSFEFNKSNDIQIDKDILSITGNIDNKPFTIETNLDKPSKLKTSDYLNKSSDIDFEIDSKNRQETPYIMPGKVQIRQKIKETFANKSADILTKSSSINEYESNIKKLFCEETKTLYGCKELVQIRIEKQMTKDVAAQETLTMLNTTIFDGQFNYGNTISKSANPELHNFLSDLDYSLENLDADEIKLRTKSIQEFWRILKDPEAKKNIKMLQDITPDTLHQTKEIMNRTSSGEKTKPSLFNFFNSLKDPHSKTFKINEFFNLLEENKKAVPNEKSFSHISENRNKETADNQLDTIFMSLEETTVVEYAFA